MSGEVILYQYAANLLFVPVDIVRPFDGNAFRPFVQFFFDGEGYELGEEELAAGFDEGGIEHEAKCKVTVIFRFPTVAALPLPGGLAFGNDCGELLDGSFLLVAKLRQVIVRRACFRQYDQWNRKLRRDNGLFRSLFCIRAGHHIRRVSFW